MKNRNELSHESGSGRLPSGDHRREIRFVTDKSLITGLLGLLETRKDFKDAKPHRCVEVSYHGVIYFGTVKQFRDASENAMKVVGGASAYIRRQATALEKADRAKAAAIAICMTIQ